MQKISIGFVVNNLVLGGVSKVLINLCNSLNPKTYDIHLIVLSSDTQMEDIMPINPSVNKVIIDYKFETGFSLIDYLKNSFNYGQTRDRAKELLKVISNLNLNILHFHTLPRQLVIGILARQDNKNLKLIFTDHSVRFTENDYQFHQRVILALSYRRLYKNYNLIAVSKAVFEYIKCNNLYNSNLRFKTLNNSIDIANYNRTKPIENSMLNCIYISRIDNFKGHITLITAWKKFQHPQKGKLFIVGPDETNGEIIKHKSNDDSIIFTGGVSNVKKYLNESSIGLFPSLKEGLPLSLLEKMAFNLPTIVSNIPALTSIIRNKVEGLHFEVNNHESFLKTLKLIYSDKELRVKMGNAARKRVEKICEENNSLKFHNEYYKEVLQETKN